MRLKLLLLGRLMLEMSRLKLLGVVVLCVLVMLLVFMILK